MNQATTILTRAGDVVGRGELPFARLVHQKGEVLGVVVAVGGEDVEDHAPESLFERSLWQLECGDRLKILVVVVRAALFEV